jgi:alkylation response protein AidB-like acyl-CoA dehydrogenase
MLPPAGAKRIFVENQQLICGSFAPPGRGYVVDGGLKISGRWSFGSGAKHADYIGGGVLVYDDAGNKCLDEAGNPDIRFALMTRDQATLEGNWDVSGLVGTDSQDYSADGVIVPDELVANISAGVEANLPDSMYKLGTYTFTVAGHASMALGLMRRALKEVAELTRGKERLGYPVPVDEFPIFLSEFAKHDAMYQTARLFVLDAFREAQQHVEREGAITPELSGRVRQASTWAHQVAEPVITFARGWAGTKAFREPSALARVGRDVAVAVTHVQVDPITLVDSAPALLEAWRSI